MEKFFSRKTKVEVNLDFNSRVFLSILLINFLELLLVKMPLDLVLVLFKRIPIALEPFHWLLKTYAWYFTIFGFLSFWTESVQRKLLVGSSLRSLLICDLSLVLSGLSMTRELKSILLEIRGVKILTSLLGCSLPKFGPL